ncbi:hypothetical protein NFHSH190041_22010 [Shewanella sp. NFH-SH190041]|nr:hypothetical protein NFHSH190041_22010 [Shewanella sp. NFH-SH190041]
MPEGQIASVGQTVVIFDKSQINSQIEQLEAEVQRVKAQRQSLKNELDVQVLQAGFNVKQAEIEQQKAQLDADIPAKYIATKKYADNQFNLYRAQTASDKARQALAENIARRHAALAQLALDRQEAELKLHRAFAELDSLTLRAGVAGPVLYGVNDNTGRKIAVGDTVQIGRPVAHIPAMDSLQIKAWVNEVDVDKLATGNNALIRLDADLARQVSASVSQIGQQARRKNGWGQGYWFEITLTLQSQDLTLQPGMSVQIQLEEQHG